MFTLIYYVTISYDLIDNVVSSTLSMRLDQWGQRHGFLGLNYGNIGRRREAKQGTMIESQKFVRQLKSDVDFIDHAPFFRKRICLVIFIILLRSIPPFVDKSGWYRSDHCLLVDRHLSFQWSLVLGWR